MVDASVGFQCPDCVREGNRDIRVGRTLSGGVIHRDPALVTKILVGLNVAVYVLQYLSDGAVNERFEMIGLRVAFENDNYRLLSAAFLHASILHIALNMYALYLFGPPVEASIGRVRFAALYLVSALGGSALSYAFANPLIPSLGASGAVFGLFAAAFVIARGRGMSEIASQLGFLIIINLAFTFGVSNISIGGHLGGLIGGAVCALVILARDRGTLGSRRVPVEVATIAVIGLACGLAAVMLAQLPQQGLVPLGV